MRKIGVVVVAGALLFSSACGGDSRPSQDDISRALQKGKAADLGLAEKLDDKTADCLAKTLVGSKLSDDALQSIVDGDDKYELSKKDKAALTPLTGSLGKCLAALQPAG